MHFDTTTITVLGSISVAVLTVLGNAVITLFTKKYEYKKSLHTMIYDCAYKEWEHGTKTVLERAGKTGEKATVYPFSYYLLFYSKYTKLLEKRNLTEKHIQQFYEEFNRNAALMEKHQEN